MSQDWNEEEREAPVVEEALKNFRLSVHGWSEHEFSGVRSVAPRRLSAFGRLSTLYKPVLAGAI